MMLKFPIKRLFEHTYPSLEALANLSQGEIEPGVSTIGNSEILPN